MGEHAVRGSGVVAVLAVALALSVAQQAHADARSEFFLRNLRTSDSFRVRSQAALALGRTDPDPQILRALTGALGDPSSAVRIAAATSLGRLGDQEALASLRRKVRDRDPEVVAAVRRAIASLEGEDSGGAGGPSRYYVGVGMPGTAAANIDRSMLSGAESFLRGQLGGMDGVVVAPDNESSAQVRRALQRRRLTGYFIDSSVVRLEDAGGRVRVDVSVIVNTYPGRDMRAILNGSATVTGSTGDRARRRAMEGAFTGALRRLPQALAAAEPRGRR